MLNTYKLDNLGLTIRIDPNQVNNKSANLDYNSLLLLSIAKSLEETNVLLKLLIQQNRSK